MPARAPPRASAPPTAPSRCACSPMPAPWPPISRGRATSSPSRRRRAASCAGPGTPRPPWIWRGSRAWSRSACSARSSTRTAAWLAAPTSSASPRSTALVLITIEELIAYRHSRERLVRKVVEVALPTRLGDFQLILFESLVDESQHAALVKGDPAARSRYAGARPQPVLHRRRARQPPLRLRRTARPGPGRHRGARPRRLPLHDAGGPRHRPRQQAARLPRSRSRAWTPWRPTTTSASRPTCATTASALRSWPSSGSARIRLLTNNPRKIVGLEAYGLEIIERLPLEVAPRGENRRYLAAKKEKLGHLLDLI